MVDEDGNFDVVTKAEFVPLEAPVYDLDVERTHNFIAEGIVTHNSVYRFRGADFRNLMRFEDAFPEATVVVLDQNYRSTQRILEAANAVIANNVTTRKKHLWTDKGEGEQITRYQGDDEHDEAQFVVREIHRLVDGAEFRYGDVAVFYRTNAQSRVLEEALVRSGVPYRVFGGVKFYDRREIKDALAYLRALVNPDDEVSWKRIVNTPRRGVGDTSVAKIDAYAHGAGLTFRAAAENAAAAGVHGKALGGLRELLALIAQFIDTLCAFAASSFGSFSATSVSPRCTANSRAPLMPNRPTARTSTARPCHWTIRNPPFETRILPEAAGGRKGRGRGGAARKGATLATLGETRQDEHSREC